MAQKRAHEVDAWLGKLDGSVGVVLLYGPDRGLVTERARIFAASTGLAIDDPFAVIRLDGAELEADPGRLMDEAGTVPMFGGTRLLWLRGVAGGKALSERIGELASAPPQDLTLLVEAGDLKKSAPLRNAVEKAAFGMALPCYADGDRDLDALIDQVLGAAGLTVAAPARSVLRQYLGGDRLASRGELEKLALYCLGAPAVELSDVEAIIPDVSATTADDVVDAVLAGRIDAVDSAFERAMNAGGSSYVVVAALIRQLQAIEQMRYSVEHGKQSAAGAVATARPPIFFGRKAAIEKAVSSIDSQTVRRLLDRLQSGVLQTRQIASLDRSLARSAILAVSSEIARARKRLR